MLRFSNNVFCTLAVVLCMALQSYGQQPLQQTPQHDENYVPQDARQGKNLLDWIGLGTGKETDPYLARANAACLGGDLAECFKSRALGVFDEFFGQTAYEVSENAKVLRMPETQLRQLSQEAFEYSESPRADESEWDQLVKFVMRKVEKFMKSTAIELNFDNEVTEKGRYSPRFVDEIADEIDIIEDKRDTLFKRKQLKKLFIPLLLVLKLFKIKLLLFLPLILGLASFKKFLGFLAIVIPGAIAFFKVCKPDFQSAFGGHQQHYNIPQYSPAGIGFQQHYKDTPPSFASHDYHEHKPTYEPSYHEYEDNRYNYNSGHKGFAFRDGGSNKAQELAYSGYSQYRGNDKDIAAETTEITSKKSILPDN